MRIGTATICLLLALSLFAPVGVAAADPAGSTAVDVGSGELHVRTTFSIDDVADDEIRVVREFHLGDGVETVEQQLPDSARDVSTHNMNRRGDTYSWDGTDDIARISFVAEAADLDGPIEAATSSSQARRGDGFAVVESTYDRMRTDATDVSTTVSVNGEGAAGENVAVLGPHETYTRASANGPIRLVVPTHANMTEAPRDVLDALVSADREIDAGLDRNETGTYVAVESDLGESLLGLVRHVSFGDNRRALDAYVRASASTQIWRHEMIHERKQSYRTTDATQWTVEGNTEYYANLMTWLSGDTSFWRYRTRLMEPDSIHSDTRLDDPDTWRGTTRVRSQYVKGEMVTMHLDARIRQATDGERTYEDVLKRMNDHEGKITHDEYVEMVVAVGGEELEPAVERYTTTEAAPSTHPNPYLFTDTSIESDIRLRDESGYFSSRSTPGDLAILTLEFANEGEENSSLIGLNSSLPDGWEVLTVGTRIPPKPVEHADYGYLSLVPGESESIGIVARVPENASFGNHTLRFTAMDVSGEESTVNTTVEVITEEEEKAAREPSDDESEERATVPPASALEVELESVVDRVQTGRENESTPVFRLGQIVNGSVSVAGGNATIVDVTAKMDSTYGLRQETGEPSTFAAEPDSPGHQTLKLEVRFENDTTRSTNREVVINDEPTVEIWAAGLQDAGETHELEADVRNEYGNITVTWYVNGEQVATGRTYEHTYREQGDNVTVVVRDEYGATDRESEQLRGMTGLEALLPRGTNTESVKMALGVALGALVISGAFLARRW